MLMEHSRIQKARINAHDALAEALELSFETLKSRLTQHSDLDQDIKLSHLPDHLQFLTSLSSSHLPSTLEYAETYLDKTKNPQKSPPTLTWKEILAEEPFEGQHWEGAYGLLPGSTVEDWETRSGGSTPSLSPLDDSDDFEEASLSSLEYEEPSPIHQGNLSTSPKYKQSPHHTHLHRQDIEQLQSRQYWREGWQTDVDLTRPFNIGDASTLGKSFHKKYIDEHNAVREMLMCLQGRANIMINYDEQSLSLIPSPTAPRLAHLTLTSQTSLLSSFAQTATVLDHLRRFTSAVFISVSKVPDMTPQPSHLLLHNHKTRTLEAFADAIHSEIRSFELWCADQEEEICRAQIGLGSSLVVSLLSLEKRIQGQFSGIFRAILDVLQTVLCRATQSSDSSAVWTLPDVHSRIPPATVTAFLLDRLFNAAQEQSSMGEQVTADALIRVFSGTVEPIWAIVGRWLREGMPVRDSAGQQDHQITLENEFFIEDNEMALVDPDFWTDGFTLRSGSSSEKDTMTQLQMTPAFLAHISEPILSAGKAVGLLRTLGISVSPEQGNDQVKKLRWYSFQSLLSRKTTAPVSTDTLSLVVYDELLPYCEAMGTQLMNVLTEDCDLSRYLSSIENLYLMKQGDVMSHFTDVLFAKMDSSQPWNDFHFLNSAFADIVDANATNWIEPSLVRISYRGSKARMINKTVKAIDGLLVEYAVPFPLTYIFTPRILQIYGSIFVFLLQIRRAKNVLERILVRGAIANVPHLRTELKAFYAMRGKLSWFVIHTQILNFRKGFEKAQSLGEMIKLHEEHLERIQGRCLLQNNTSAIYRAILSILDMCLYFSEFFVSFAGDTTHDISRLSISMKRHRSRRQRRQRKNVIGFSQPSQESEDSSDNESDNDEKFTESAPEPSFSMATSTMSFAEEEFSSRLEKLSSELDGLVRFIRRGAESFAGGTGQAAPAFGVLAFALEDWDS
ncbi:hypothetical protein SERLADRAFT_447295 [Serpula lacrymans var. lacrymans S7.9]|uniref:Spindle pole body component n=1 Tax=Serpula lacrymans var. lacrymans (strain S7.9) TaxID=578457 RepID=F8NNY3_SERL9|nr:uncharacterized protein SERLADRAFT_447295 [Serpula lacrymans var. lacrymans S7.9]EGO28082.1 hypothetical protein SERLADRAFT_447295 [Serpula lacrymans var. lacrymans S7.9]